MFANIRVSSSFRPLAWIRQSWAFNWPLTLVGLACMAMIPVFAAAIFLDPVVITGVPGWIKPLKFAISVSIYCLTLVLLLTYVRGRRILVRSIAGVVAAALSIEMVLIITQVVRRTTSHFNYATTFDAVVFSTMGALISVVALLTLIVAILLIFQPMEDRVFAWSLRLAVLITFAGMLVGFLMTSGPTPAQQSAASAAAPLTIVGAHSVGVEDGGPGLPLVGWSTQGGDLRIPHFFGLHALQVLPIIGWLLGRRAVRRRLSEFQRVGLVWIAGAGYLGMIGLLTWQALRGQSVASPDALTLAAFALWAVVMALAGFVVVYGPRRAANVPSTTRA